MNNIRMLLLGVAALPVCLLAQETDDSVASGRERELELNEVVVVAKRPVMKQQEGKLVYLVKNDPYAPKALMAYPSLTAFLVYPLITEQYPWPEKGTSAI